MRRLRLATLAFATLALALLGAATASAMEIEAVIWQLGTDYPGSKANDGDIPVQAVYIKTHDGTDWMATYDDHPKAVAGPDSIRQLIDTYRAQGIRVVAWFVPKGQDIEGQVGIAEQVLDAGVDGLYADLEPFPGFCNQDCDFLAENLWRRVRAERPNANLGVIYDPRTQWWGPSATAKWLSVADAALPMCYWETYAGQQPWNDPSRCVLQAYADLAQLAPGRALQYIPMLQGDSTPDRFKAALDAAASVGADRVSIWRRGVVSAELWDWLASYAPPPSRPCWVIGSDNCLIRETSGSSVYLLQGGAAFLVPDTDTLLRLGLDPSAVLVVPDQFVNSLSPIPRDGTLLAEEDAAQVYVVAGGARFPVTGQEVYGALSLDPAAVRKVPRGGLDQIPLVPGQYTRLREASSGLHYVVIGGNKIALEGMMLSTLLAAGQGQQLFVAPDGGLDQIPTAVVERGDVDCSGQIDSVDALRTLQGVAALPNLGVCAEIAGDVNCDDTRDSVDALFILRRVAALDSGPPAACGE